MTQIRIFKNNQEIPMPKGSARFLDCSLTPISEAGQYMRGLDGSATWLGYEDVRRYDVSISCSDIRIPPISGVWPGDVLTIHWPEVESEPGPSVMLQREPVPGSVVAYDAAGQEISRPVGRLLNVPGADRFDYRAVLTVLVTAAPTSGTEGKARRSWSLSATESQAAEVVPDVPVLPDELVEATGGVVTDYTDADGARWREHDILTTDIFDVSAPGMVEVAIASAGGGGPHSGVVGGAAGGGVSIFTTRVSAGAYPVVIGAGGAKGSSSDRHGNRGSDSSIFGISPRGGGGGLGATGSTSGLQKDGGSGGGQRAAGVLSPGNGIPGVGHRGGAAQTSGDDYFAGGGGGAGGPGEDGSSATRRGGNAGPGIGVGYMHSSGSLILGAGSPGSTYIQGTGNLLENVGDLAIGGAAFGAPGTPNTGSAGGTWVDGYPSQNGGSGRAIIRYRIA